MTAFRNYLVLLLLFVISEGFSQVIDREELIYLTSSYTGDRYEDGRPKISNDLLQRAEHISIDVAWQILDNEGYFAQYEGDWKTLNSEVIVGRAVTAMYLPSRPDVESQILKRGHNNGRKGNSNSWPIEQLQKGDVYVADAFGKTIGGTLIGDNLANAIYAKTGKGVIFYGASRDKEGLATIQGFNAYVKNWNPTFLKNVMLGGLNTPIHIGDALVMPGDLVLAKAEGVVFIPAHLAEKVIESAEFIELRDAFGHSMLRDGVYSSGEIDNEWTTAIKEHFLKWIKQERSNASLSIEQIEQFMKQRTW